MAPHETPIQPSSSAGVISGTWRARASENWTQRGGERWMSIRLERDGDHDYGISIRLAELEAAGIRGDVPDSANARFPVRRDAGTLDFQGSFDAGRGSGTFRFEPSAAFMSAQQAAGRPVTVEDTLRLGTFIKDIRSLGYTDITLDDFVRMRIHGVTPQFIRELKDVGYGSLSKDRQVQFRIHGVDAEFIREVQKSGMKDMSAEDLVDFSIHGGRRWLRRTR
jgi:hypothetical protein